MTSTLSRYGRSLIITLLVLALMGSAWAHPGSADPPTTAGHWDDLGEDGRIWVPADPPATAALPPEDLGDYHNHTETVDTIMRLADDRPDLFTLTDIGTSVQGRTLWMVTVSAPGDADQRTRVLFDAAHHGNEVIGSETLTRLLLEIETAYDTDPAMQALLDRVVLDVVPIVNVDGHANTAYCNHYADCRKNANGVDLNRNYPANWGGAGSSSSPGSATYHGPAPLSEPESQAIAALLDTVDHAHHVSMHSGTELVLWPYGWTTQSPPEVGLYQSLGAELSAISGARHGQASKILYTASGTTMDYAYQESDHWHPVSFTPEIYGGSGGAFDWWRYFNPREVDADIAPVVTKWKDSLWHLVAEAPLYRPARLDVPGTFAFGPDAATLTVNVSAAEKRPFVDASVRFTAGDAPVRVLSQNPVLLSDQAGNQTVTFELLADRGGTFEAHIILDGGPGGQVVRSLSLDLAQVEMDLDLARSEMGVPDPNTASVVLDAGPFDEVRGTLAFEIATTGRSLGTFPFTVTPGAPTLLEAAFDARDLDAGEHHLRATAFFTSRLDGIEQEGYVQAEAPFLVKRPQLEPERFTPARSATLEPVNVIALYHNTGTHPATDVVVEERLPPGYLYWMRDGPVPIPQDPLGSPAPDEVRLNPDGSMNVTWSLGDIEPGGQGVLRYRFLPVAPGLHTITSSWAYTGAFETEEIRFHGSDERTHEAT